MLRVIITTFVITYMLVWGIVSSDAAKRYLASSTTLVVPNGVSQIELTYLDTDDNVIFRRAITVKGEQKFVVKVK